VLISNAVSATTEQLLAWFALRWQIETNHPHYTSSARWVTNQSVAYHLCERVA